MARWSIPAHSASRQARKQTHPQANHILADSRVAIEGVQIRRFCSRDIRLPSVQQPGSGPSEPSPCQRISTPGGSFRPPGHTGARAYSGVPVMTTRSRIAFLAACSMAALGLATASPSFAASTASTPTQPAAQQAKKPATHHRKSSAKHMKSSKTHHKAPKTTTTSTTKPGQ